MGYHNAKNDPNDITPVPPGDPRHQVKHSPEAEALADAVLIAAGSGLRHYAMASIRNRIFEAAQQGIDDSRKDLLEALENLIEHFDSDSGDAKMLRHFIEQGRIAINAALLSGAH